MRHKPRFKDNLRKHWFPVGILICILLASIHPRFGSKDGTYFLVPECNAI